MARGATSSKRRRRHSASPTLSRKRRCGSLHISQLPDNVLVKIFTYLAQDSPLTHSPVDEDGFRDWTQHKEVSLGLRSHPCLGQQVCKRWHRLLNDPRIIPWLWTSLTVDLAYETLVAGAVLGRANPPPRVRPEKIMKFVQARATSIRSLSVCDSEGFWTANGEYRSLRGTHGLTPSSLSMLLGALATTLETVEFLQTSDLIALRGGPLSSLSSLRRLRTLRLEGVEGSLDAGDLEAVGWISSLEHLTISASDPSRTTAPEPATPEASLSAPASGPPGALPLELPASWRRLGALRSLALRNCSQLRALPAWASGAWPRLASLDISCCAAMDLSQVGGLVQLRRLRLEDCYLVEEGPVVLGRGRRFPLSRVQLLPDLAGLVRLEALSLAQNALLRIPFCLDSLESLRTLDLSNNAHLELDPGLVAADAAQGRRMGPARPRLAQSLARLRRLDLRGIHAKNAAPRGWEEGWRETCAIIRALKEQMPEAEVLHNTLC